MMPDETGRDRRGSGVSPQPTHARVIHEVVRYGIPSCQMATNSCARPSLLRLVSGTVTLPPLEQVDLHRDREP